jgi:hypothetical protein
LSLDSAKLHYPTTNKNKKKRREYYLVENAHLNGSQRQRDTPHSIHQQVKKRQKEKKTAETPSPLLRRFPLRPVHAAEPWACRGLGAGTSCQPLRDAPAEPFPHC